MRPRSIPATATATAVVLMGFLLAAGCQRSGGLPAGEGADSTDRIAAERDSTTSSGEPAERGDDSPAGAVRVVRSYYEAIDARRYEDAYRHWASGGAASGLTFERFRDGFARTAAVEVETGAPGGMGAAAGSRYVDVPVRIVARLRDGSRQEFSGTYTLRRSVVDGATPEQRTWHIYQADVRPRSE